MNTYGPAFNESLDGKRLRNQFKEIFNLMSDGKWRTLAEIEQITGYPQASASADLRHMRKAAFGGHRVDKQRRDTPGHGTWEYRVTPSIWEGNQKAIGL